MTDTAGKREWDRTFGVDGGEAARSVMQTGDGGFILVGDATPEGSSRLYVAKMDSLGSEEWKATLGDDANGGLESVRQTSDGGYIVAGATSDVYTIKLDRHGNVEWGKRGLPASDQ